MPAYDDRRFSPPAPSAGIVIRHPDSGASVADIQMLVDSGADATPLPRSAVSRLGIAGTGERFQLMAFDGAISEAEVVRADLIFLRRRFRGRFMLLDEEIGVIGRDIPNHVRLLPDGPGLRWDVWPPTATDASRNPTDADPGGG
jgi:hypothetical protein